MANPGVSPLDPATPVGQLRSLVGDTEATPLDPPIDGEGSYAIWSDVALEAALGLAGDSVYRAASNLYFTLAAEYAQSGRSIKTDDLSIDTKGRAGSLIEIARSWASAANQADAADDFFEIVPFTSTSTDWLRPEGAPWSNHSPVAPPSPPAQDGYGF
jgi:hypothetical protein